jgi:cytochrome c-type biogenesis protein CcmH/NrfG
MVTNIDTGREEAEGFDPLLMTMLALVLLAVVAVGIFMWISYQSAGVPRAPATVSLNVKH